MTIYSERWNVGGRAGGTGTDLYRQHRYVTHVSRVSIECPENTNNESNGDGAEEGPVFP